MAKLPKNNQKEKEYAVFVVDTSQEGEGNVCSKKSVDKAKEKNWVVYDYNSRLADKKPYEGSEPTPAHEKYVAFTSESAIGQQIFITATTKDNKPIEVEGLLFENSMEFDGEKVDTYQITANDMLIIGDLTSLNLQENYLTSIDVTHAPSLEKLVIEYNEKLTKLDLSKSAALKRLHLSSTGIDELMLQYTPLLQELHAASTPLKNIDLTYCSELEGLNLNATQVSSLNLSKCPKLSYLSITKIPITALDLRACTHLQKLYFSECNVSEIDLSSNKELIHLWCNNNQLSQLVVNAPKLEYLYCYGNKIGEKSMEALINSLPNRKGYAKAGEFVPVDMKNEKEGNRCTIGQVAKAKEANWNVFDYNGGTGAKLPYEGIVALDATPHTQQRVHYEPTSCLLSLEGFAPFASVRLFGMSGECLLETQTDAQGSLQMPLSNLKSGVYVVGCQTVFSRFVK